MKFSYLLPLFACLVSCVSLKEKSMYNGEILCSDQETRNVLVMKHDGDWAQAESVLWCWNANDDEGLTDEEKNCFSNPSDTKAVNGGRQILVIASGGAAALIDVASCKAVFIALPKGNPHSGDLLPDGSIATISSGGARLMLFTRQEGNMRPYKTIQVPIDDGHGVVWDEKRQCLWALGKTELATYKYNFNPDAPELTKTASFSLGNSPFHGHDLVLLKKQDQLLITGYQSVMKFDMKSHEFSTFIDEPAVKSISIHPENGTTIVQIPDEKWWSDSVKVLRSDKRWTLPNAKIYKARWFF